MDPIETTSTPQGKILVEDDGSEKRMPALVPYLLFGYGAEDDERPMLDVRSAYDYLGSHGFGNGPLTRARTGADARIEGKDASGHTVHRCAFCGRPLVDVPYDHLMDGRDRCMECGATAVRGFKKNRELVEEVRRTMCEMFSIDLDVAFDVKVVSARRLAKRLDQNFDPSGVARTVGLAVAQKKTRDGKTKYEVYLENGRPRFDLTVTAAHEFTHIWQYTHWDMEAIKAKYGKFELAITEGMAKWAECQYAFFLGNRQRAEWHLRGEACRTDEYGFGLRLFAERYHFYPGRGVGPDTPFRHPEEPIPPELIAQKVQAARAAASR